jgi:hypothetical protein
MKKSATLSSCGLYRFTLSRQWNDRHMLMVCMFNPSTADADKDDPTISLLCHIANFNGFGGIRVVNLCPLRSAKPQQAIAMFERAQLNGNAVDRIAMFERAQLNGNAVDRKVLWDNQETIENELKGAGAVLLAWGAMGFRAGDWYSTTMATLRSNCAEKTIYVLGKCSNGHPKHPMARGLHKIPKDAPLIPWSLG